MSELPEKLYSAQKVRELDRIAIEQFDIPGYELMRRAGRASFELLRARWATARNVLVVAGTGNNGGDGYVIARLAKEAGMNTRVVQRGNIGRIRGDAGSARDDYLAAGGLEEGFGKRLPGADVVVDALLGTGLEDNVRGAPKTAIEAINAQEAPVLAVDVPSGLHSDTGVPLGVAVRARCTISFIGLKQGLFTGLAADHCGEIVFDGLGIPPEVFETVSPSAHRVESAQFGDWLAPRPRTSHKGHFGHVLVIGGERGMAGAPRMAAEAAARVGAGLVSVATKPAHAAFVNIMRPELMVHPVERAADLRPLLKRATVVAIGPGLGQTDWSRAMLGAILDSTSPAVIDADALNLLASDPLRRENGVLTPHPGEAARLLGMNTKTIQQDRYGAVMLLRERYGGVCVLKGAGTLIGSSERIAVCTGGNPGMASGGMGDVLGGVIAGLMAQGLSAPQAAELGVCVHAAAADRAAATRGERGVLATDLFDHLQLLVNP
ncbi:MAG: NAD(P)H-hydrate dehydratase [Gammaproteobacteria bacterium]|nr:NAD(P)H-hydrate dehydratase [Gammaproteobacteria bacterium]